MNRYLTVGFSMLAGTALGAGAVQSLHAQAKPPAFAVAEITVKNQAHYLNEFIPAVRRTIKTANASVIVRGGKLDTLLGTPPASRIVIVEFPSFDAAEAWWNAQPTQNAFKIGEKYASFLQYVVQGTPQ